MQYKGFLICFLLFWVIEKTLTVKADSDGLVTSASETTSTAKAEQGNVAAVGLAEAKGVSANEVAGDKVASASISKSEAETGKGNAVSIALSDSSSKNSNTQDVSADNLLSASSSEATSKSQEGNTLAVAASVATASKDINGSDLVSKPDFVLTATAATLFNTGKRALDLGVGSEGDLYIAGLDGLLYHYELTDNSWRKIEADYELGNVVRVM